MIRIHVATAGVVVLAVVPACDSIPSELPPLTSADAIALAFSEDGPHKANGTTRVGIRVQIPGRERKRIDLATTGGSFSPGGKASTKLLTEPVLLGDGSHADSMGASVDLVLPNATSPIIVSATLGKFSVSDTVDALLREEPTGVRLRAEPFGTNEHGNRVATILAALQAAEGTVTRGAGVTFRAFQGDSLTMGPSGAVSDASGAARWELVVHLDEILHQEDSVLTVTAETTFGRHADTVSVRFRAGG